MDHSSKSETTRILIPNQRRTQSVDTHSLSPPREMYNGNSAQYSQKMPTSVSQETMDEYGDDYACAPLPKVNSRPTAKTCWRARSAFAPLPKCNFGPKGTLKKVKNNEEYIVIQDPSSQRLHWISSPNNILVVRKPGPSTWVEFETLVVKLLKRRLNVFVELPDHTKLPFANDTNLQEHVERCVPLDKKSDLDKIDLIICLGGDGTLLHASNMFQKSCPPVLSFSMGSLGFLVPFDFKSHEDILNEVLSGNVPVLLRTRINCTIIQDEPNDGLSTSAPDVTSLTNDANPSHDTEAMSYLALNEVVIDRGPNSYLSNIDLYINDKFITKVQGDGLIISTPTGSTAYAMAAGASMVHPSVPAMVICPICPHSLSFRPIVVPAGVELKAKVSEGARLSAWLSVDGRNRYELRPGEKFSVKITTSVYPMPCITRSNQVGDWFESLADILHWNIRKTQLGLQIDHVSERNELTKSQDERNDNVPRFE